VFIVTSPDLFLGNFAEKDGYTHLRETLGVTDTLYLNPERGQRLETLADFYRLRSARVPVVSVHDGEPGLLDNIGSAAGVRQKTLAIRKTSKSGSTTDIFQLHHIDAESVAEAAREMLKVAASDTVEVAKSLQLPLEQ
jgi:pyruvate dehydrogenase E1 component